MSTTGPSIPGASAANPPVLPGAQVARTKNWPWYISSTDFRLTPTGRQIFEEYSNIVPADVETTHLPHCKLPYYIRFFTTLHLLSGAETSH